MMKKIVGKVVVFLCCGSLPLLVFAQGLRSERGEAVVPIRLTDTPMNDDYARLRTAPSTSMFSVDFEYGLQSIKMLATTAESGAVEHAPLYAAALLTTAEVDGSFARLESRRYVRDVVGRTQTVYLATQVGVRAQNVTKRVGQFDSDDGVYFRQNYNGLAWCLRSSISGTPTTECVEQEDWNLDTMESEKTSPSETRLDPLYPQIMVITTQWMGGGRIRVGFIVEGRVIYNHQFTGTHTEFGPMMKTATLPVAWEMEASGAAPGVAAMYATAAHVSSDSGVHFDKGYQFAAATAAAGIAVTTDTPVLAIAPTNAMPQGGTQANETTVYLQNVSVLVTSSDSIQWKLIYGATLDDTGWSAVNATYSGMMQSTSVVYTASSGIMIASGFATSTNQASVLSLRELSSKLALVRNGFGLVDGAVRGNVILLATAVDGNATVAAEIQWAEVY